MPWFGGGGKKSGLPPPSNLQIQKTKQVESLKKGNLNVKETIRDVEYRVTLQSAGNNITLVISLPPQFPAEKPTVSVEPAVRHPWVDQQSKVVACPNLMNFSVHSSLYAAVTAIVEEFRAHPPALVSHVSYESQSSGSGFPTVEPPPPPYAYPSTDPGFPLYGSQVSPGPTSPPPMMSAPTDQPNSPNGASQSQIPGMSGVPIADFSQINVFSAFPDLKDKSHLELLELMEEEDRVLEMIQQLPQVQQVAEEREKISCRCSNLAKENLSQRPTIEELKQTVAEKISEFDSLRTEFEQHQEKQLTLMDQFHPSIIQNNLKVAILEAEEESEKCVEDFMNKKMDTEAFIHQFLEIRTLYHTRKGKEEKMNHMRINPGF